MCRHQSHQPRFATRSVKVFSLVVPFQVIKKAQKFGRAWQDIGNTVVFQPELPMPTRNKWGSDPIRGAHWRTALQSFDSIMAPYLAPAAGQPTTQTTQGGGVSPLSVKINANEPRTVAELAQAYDILATFPSRVPTVVFVLTTGPHKQGNATATQPEQNMKLWAQASADVEYPTSPFLISHMNGAFLNKKNPKKCRKQV